jgi:hypothetical protein
MLICLAQDVVDTPDFTVLPPLEAPHSNTNQINQDSDTQPNTSASSVAGDVQPADGRKRRTEATQLRKSVLGKKLNRLDESKVRHTISDQTGLTNNFYRKTTPYADSGTYSA